MTSLQVYDYSKISRLVDLYKTFFLSPPPRNRVVSRLGTIKSSRFCERISYSVIGSSIRVHLEQTFLQPSPSNQPFSWYKIRIYFVRFNLPFCFFTDFILFCSILNLRRGFRHEIALKLFQDKILKFRA